ncbi:YihY/virulence factor BrkB family protein [Halothiobacillus sp.]|uniref:YihY/virulence factor BrkB family protein n=1 Tax=Halothiobacillus sp. TaxID=1891311 RepID=UPI0026166463|nr:YhjD/YihY/BrkB family envelope integrity protein [Halothiobacillus sp.]MDD4965855.1 YhjD/YihY/BrkB family envelope integrity protein [Halothiobacillus sp.]
MKNVSLMGLLTAAQRWIWHARPHRRYHRIGQRLGRIGLYISREAFKGNLQLNAMSLSYITLLSLVPLLAVSFSVLKAFGSDQVIEPFLTTLLEPLGSSAEGLTTQILTFVGNIKVGVLGAVGIAMLFFTVVTLMQKIESVFNGIWHVLQLRQITTRFPMYLTVLMVGPVLVLAATGLTASLLSNHFVTDFTQHSVFRDALASIAWLVPFMVWVAVFTFIYAMVPNTSVRFSSALAGGVVAAILWNGIGLAFGSMIATSTQYTAIYSAFASLILFMVWLQLAWMIVLLGATVSYAWQNIEQLPIREKTEENHPFVLMTAALEALSRIEAQFHNAKAAPGTDELKHTLLEVLSIDPDDTQQALEQLAKGGLINLVVTQQREGWVPAMPTDRLNLAQVRAALWGQPDVRSHKLYPVTRAWMDAEQQLIEQTLGRLDFTLNHADEPSVETSIKPRPTDLQANPIGK